MAKSVPALRMYLALYHELYQLCFNTSERTREFEQTSLSCLTQIQSLVLAVNLKWFKLDLDKGSQSLASRQTVFAFKTWSVFERAGRIRRRRWQSNLVMIPIFGPLLCRIFFESLANKQVLRC